MAMAGQLHQKILPSFKDSAPRRLQQQPGQEEGQRRLLSASKNNANDEGALQQQLEAHLELFRHVDKIEVMGPSVFPKPTDVARRDEMGPGQDKAVIVPYMKPVSGAHRPDQDVVIAFASEYPLSNYIGFIESLRETGFQGDVVLAVSKLDVDNPETWDYLRTAPHVVVYVPKIVCFNFEHEQVKSAKGGIRTCVCHELWGYPNGTVLPDPRPERTLATTRYEIYWIMIQNYQPHSWMLLVDARDTFFQSNPFVHLPRGTDPTGQSGLLYFFGENVDATRLGRSKSNSKWLHSAYGDFVGHALEAKPTLCSGATLGEQVALEAYTRAMVAEYDDSGTVLMGADQGFHNYLYYSHKLKNAAAIHDIVVFDQGTGLVNNLGAMRTRHLNEWGNGQLVRVYDDTDGQRHYEVRNWDGTPSPVVHQFDRHKELSDYFFKFRIGQLVQKWKDRRQ